MGMRVEEAVDGEGIVVRGCWAAWVEMGREYVM